MKNSSQFLGNEKSNRTIKVSSGSVDFRAIFRPKTIERFTVHTKLNPNVVLLRLFPSIMVETVAHFLKPPIEGVVLQCYGAGNIPNSRLYLPKYVN